MTRIAFVLSTIFALAACEGGYGGGYSSTNTSYGSASDGY